MPVSEVQPPNTKKKHKAKAGLIPYFINEDGRLEILLMVPSDPAYGGSDKQFCKGQIDEGETPLDAAKREGMEELGFIPENAISEYLELGKLNGIDFFAVEVNSKNLNPFHYETGSVHWIGMSEAFKIIREFQRPMLGTFFKVVRSKYSKNLY